jgi:hypothetical protein
MFALVSATHPGVAEPWWGLSPPKDGGACGIQNNGWKSITKNSLLPGSLTSYLPGRKSPRRCAIGAGDLLIPNSPGER